MADVDRTGFSDLMIAYENKIAKSIIEEATRMELKKIETVMVIEVILEVMKNEIRKEMQERRN